MFGGFGSANGNAFGSPSAFGGVQSGNNSFNSGFGSPTQSSSFQTTAPAFGQTPSFGGAATFGSPKGGFGTFANSSFASSNTQQGNSLFESLGSQQTGMTFGNLAQGAQIAPQAPKPFAPQGGGSGSFSTWR